MTDQTPAYLLITTDQSVNPVNTPFPSVEAARHDFEKSVPLLTQQLRDRFNTGNRARMVFFSLNLTRSNGHPVEQQTQFLVPVGKTAFSAVASFVAGDWETTTMYLDPETWEPVNAEG